MIHNGKSRKLLFDPAEAVAHLRASDPKLGALIDRCGEFTLRLDPLPSPFESLLESILYQQLNGKAAATIHGRSARILWRRSRPATPSRYAPMRSCAPRASPATRRAPSRTWPPAPSTHKAIGKMTDEEIVERLTQVRGIGPWTVEMLLIFRMGRPDVFPVTDYGVRKGFALTFQRIPKPARLPRKTCPSPRSFSKGENAGRRSVLWPVGTSGEPVIWPRLLRPRDGRAYNNQDSRAIFRRLRYSTGIHLCPTRSASFAFMAIFTSRPAKTLGWRQ